MLGADLAAEISAKFLHSYIRTCHPSAVRTPGRIRYADRPGQKPGGCESDLDLATVPWSTNVGMYESHPFILSQALDTGTGNKNFRTFVRSYADC